MAVKRKKKASKKRVIKRKVGIKRTVKRKPTKRPSVKKIAKKAQPAAKKQKGIIGIVTHYFPKVRAAVIKLKTPLSVGDTVRIKGHTTDFTQTITSMQIDHVSISSGKKGDEIGLLVDSRVRENDVACKP